MSIALWNQVKTVEARCLALEQRMTDLEAAQIPDPFADPPRRKPGRPPKIEQPQGNADA